MKLYLLIVMISLIVCNENVFYFLTICDLNTYNSIESMKKCHALKYPRIK